MMRTTLAAAVLAIGLLLSLSGQAGAQSKAAVSSTGRTLVTTR